MASKLCSAIPFKWSARRFVRAALCLMIGATGTVDVLAGQIAKNREGGVPLGFTPIREFRGKSIKPRGSFAWIFLKILRLRPNNCF